MKKLFILISIVLINFIIAITIELLLHNPLEYFLAFINNGIVNSQLEIFLLSVLKIFLVFLIDMVIFKKITHLLRKKYNLSHIFMFAYLGLYISFLLLPRILFPINAEALTTLFPLPNWTHLE